MEGFFRRESPEAEKARRKREVGNVARAVALGAALLGGAVQLDRQAESVPETIDAPITEVLRDLKKAHDTLPSEEFEARLREVPTDHPRATTELGLLSYNLQARPEAVHEDEALSHVGRFDKTFALPLVQHTAVPKGYWEGVKTMFENETVKKGLAENKANEKREEIRAFAPFKTMILKEVSAHFGGVDPVELEESVAMLSRNLWWHGVQANPAPEVVRAEAASILEQRHRLSNENFWGRKVVVVSHSEIDTSGKPAFGKPGFIQGIAKRQRQEQISQNVESITAFVGGVEATDTVVREHAEAAKEKALAALRDGAVPTTFVFDGHGGKDGFYFYAGEVLNGHVNEVNEVSIDVSELADALQDRWKMQHAAHPEDTQLNATLIFSACYMQDFLRKVANMLEMQDVPLPHLMITASEFGQYSFYDSKGFTGSDFNQSLIARGRLGDLIRKKHHPVASESGSGSSDGPPLMTIEMIAPAQSTPTIFVPRPENPKQLMQIGGIVVPAETMTG